ncbi:chemosensory receptor b [Plakobranchus ocellatus]|uniref:Chemosensory receptor b n=1 Tax=Plakobranchus ocellatus TaxID=259542 RepID=A0AAV4BH69_9GAST|nr:chemosensory receptor b [Plakobranchus ocellatus]
MNTGLYLTCNETNSVSEGFRNVWIYINYVVLGNVVACFGLFTNTLNIIVYWKHGLSDSITVALFALSVSDFCMLLTFVMLASFHIPRLFVVSNATTFVRAVAYYFCGGLRTAFARISVWTTALIACERCMCILFPLKIKYLLTRKKTAWAIVLGSAMILIALIPLLLTLQVETFPDPRSNATFSRLNFKSVFSPLHHFAFFLQAIMQNFSLVAIAVANAVLMWALKKRTQRWASGPAGQRPPNRRMSANNRPGGEPPENHRQIAFIHLPNDQNRPQPLLSSRSFGPEFRVINRDRIDRKMGRMVVILSGIHLTCLIPTFVWVWFVQAMPEFKILNSYSKYQCAAHVIWSFTTLLEVGNASINILIYYHMSTRYRQTLDTMLAKCRKKQNRVFPAGFQIRRMR